MNRYEAGWRASTSPVAYPRNYYIRFDDGNQVLGLSDPPKVGSSEAAQLVVPFAAWPTPMTASTQIPFTDTNGATRHGLAEYHQAFVRYAADAVGASVADESESGTYGRCLIDGAPIDPKRLDAVPWAPYCVRHQKLLEVPNLVIGGGTWWARTVYFRTSSRGSAMSSSGSKDAMGNHRRE